MSDPIKEKAREWAAGQADELKDAAVERLGYEQHEYFNRGLAATHLATAVEPLLRVVEAAQELTNELDNPTMMRSTRRRQLRNALAALPKELR